MTLRKTRDLLQEKEKRLAELASKSASAIQLVQATIDNLQTVNSDISGTMDEIDTYVERLNNTRNSLGFTYAKNEKIMQNFAKLLCQD